MIKFGKGVVKARIPILIISLLLIIPSVFGILGTRINYDILDYLPEDMDTVQGQNILLEDFDKGGFSLIVLDGMKTNEITTLETKLRDVDHVSDVIWYDSIFDVSVPLKVIPEKYYEVFNNDDETMLAVFFDTATSADETIQAIQDIRKVCDERCYVTGMSALVTDLKQLCEKEEPLYVAIAVACAIVIMMLTMDSWIIPIIFLISIGMAIVYNLGSNYFMGEISYITKALSAVLQLAVTMDYSIFLWHSYSENKERYEGDKQRAMAHAISNTFSSVLGSSITTIAGFIALCFMTFTMGRDLGIVMAKGVLFGVIACVTILPSLILTFDKLIEKTKHKSLIPDMTKVAKWIVSKPVIFLVAFAVIAVPAVYGYANEKTYYDMSKVLPQDIDYVVANTKLQDDFNMASTHMILADSKLSSKDTKEMLDKINKTDGVKFALGMDSVVGSLIPKEALPQSIKGILESKDHQLILVGSEYYCSSDEVNNQISQINDIIKSYDDNAMLIGEAPCTKDLIDVTDRDFTVVSIISIVAIFIIIACVLKSYTLPIILVLVIEFAISINLGIPFYTDKSLVFIAPICISTIQLGATVDYAILMTTRYKKERSRGNDKKGSITTALAASMPSIIVSALGFFGATFGVAIYSKIDIISSMCMLMARGALISMAAVIFVLPAFFVLLDKVICKTSMGFKPDKIKTN